MPRYEELRLNNQNKSNGYRQRSSRVEQTKNNMAKPLVFSIFVIIIFAIIFSIIKTYGPSVSIAFKDFFRIAQSEAIFSEVAPTVLENEDVSFLSTIPGFRFFVPSDDNTAIEIVAEETNERVGARVRNESDDMFQEFASTSRITRDALAPFFNNVLSTMSDTNSNGSTNLLNVSNLVNAFGLTNTSIISNNDNLENKNMISNQNEVVESTTFDEVLKPRTEVYDRTKMKPAHTRRYTENDPSNIVFETNTYSKPVIKEREKFVEYTDEELEENRKEFYDSNDLEKTDDVRKITEVPKGRVVPSTKTPKNDRETVNISKEILENASPKTKNIITKEKIILPKERTLTSETETQAVVRPKENIIVPSPLPKDVRNNNNSNNNIERITSPKENNNLVPKEDVLIENDTQVKDKETTATKETKTKTQAVVRPPKENIIVPSPLPKDVRNNNNSNNNIERITSPKENNNLVPKEDVLIENDTQVKDKETTATKETKTKTQAVVRPPKENIIVPSPLPETVRNNNNSNNNIERITSPKENNNLVLKEDVLIENDTQVKDKETTLTTETKTQAVVIPPKENIIVPSPLPEALNNNNNSNNIERITSPKENNNLAPKEDNDALLKNNETLLNNNNTDFNSIITNETYLPTETQKETSSVTRVPSGGINYDNGIKKLGIFLVEYNEDDGTISLVFQERDIDKEEFTLEKAILTLLEGATDSENKNNIISIIPKNVELLDIFREDNTVYLNFSSNFEYNAIGNEGMLVQLYQFVYTATQFDDVLNVVFLVDGKYNEFIGAEGSIVNSPFQRLVRDDNVLIDVLK